MSLDMLLQVLGPLEGLTAKATLVRFERDVNPNVGGDVVTFDRASVTSLPATDKVQVISALSSDMSFTEVLKEALSRVSSLTTLLPLA